MDRSRAGRRRRLGLAAQPDRRDRREGARATSRSIARRSSRPARRAWVRAPKTSRHGRRPAPLLDGTRRSARPRPSPDASGRTSTGAIPSLSRERLVRLPRVRQASRGDAACGRAGAVAGARACPRRPRHTPEKPPPLVVNVGTRVQAVLTDPVVTGAAWLRRRPSSRRTSIVGDRLAIPAGTVLVGEGFATQQDDRAQVVFSAIVKDGKTLQFEGWALQEGEIGVKGKVVRKASKGKKGAGQRPWRRRVRAHVRPQRRGRRAPEARHSAASAIPPRTTWSGVGRDWRRSDKVVRSRRASRSLSTSGATSRWNEPPAGPAVPGRGVRPDPPPAVPRRSGGHTSRSSGSNPRVVVALVVNLGVPSYWLARRLSQALLLRSTGAKLKATHEPP